MGDPGKTPSAWAIERTAYWMRRLGVSEKWHHTIAEAGVPIGPAIARDFDAARAAGRAEALDQCVLTAATTPVPSPIWTMHREHAASGALAMRVAIEERLVALGAAPAEKGTT
jgi:hypothetical protein